MLVEFSCRCLNGGDTVVIQSPTAIRLLTNERRCVVVIVTIAESRKVAIVRAEATTEDVFFHHVMPPFFGTAMFTITTTVLEIAVPVTTKMLQ
jgi:hypothetical protein